MKSNYLLKQLNHLTPRTAIVREQKQFIKIAFAVHLSAVISAERYRSDSVALKSAVLHFVFFMIIINKMQQSAAQSCSRTFELRVLPFGKTSGAKLLNFVSCPLSEVFPLTKGSGKTMAFENRHVGCKEREKINRRRIFDTLRINFFETTPQTACIFSKEDEHAQRMYIKYGNGVETRYKYDEKRRWLDSIETKNTQTQDVFQKIKYNFDAVGNVLGYANDATTYETQQTYSYDNLYQLISVEGTSNQYKGKKSFGLTPVSVAKYKQTFSFDNIGNMTNKLSTTNIPGSQGNSYPKAELDYDLNYEYDPAYAHRLIRAGTRHYRYDANGNITAEKDGPFTDEEEFTFTYSYFENEDVYGTDYGFGLDAPKETEQANPQDLFAYRRNYTWNERNLLTKSSDRNFTVHYRYGDDGQRALKYTDEGRSETLYFNNFFTIHIPTQDQNNPQGLRVHKHIFVGNSRLVTAMTHTDNSGDNEEQKVKRYYYHSDHLGSAQFVTDWHGRQYEHIEYTPYGELWIEEVAAGLDKLPFRFTGKELDEETGLYYYGARYLDPKYSRWLSGDPALGEYMAGSSVGEGGIYNAVNFNVYHYGGNNPIKYVDPTGMWSDNGDGTYTAEKGDTLFELYGDDWKEKSGYEGDPTKMPIGTIVGNKFEEPEDRDRNNSMTNILSPEQIEAFAPDNASSSASNENKYSQTKNIVLGIGEMIGGLIMVGGTVYVAAMSPPTAVNPGAQGLLLPGFGFFAHGLGRVVGANNNTIGEDIKSSFMPPEAATMEELVKDQRRKKR